MQDLIIKLANFIKNQVNYKFKIYKYEFLLKKFCKNAWQGISDMIKWFRLIFGTMVFTKAAGCTAAVLWILFLYVWLLTV